MMLELAIKSTLVLLAVLLGGLVGRSSAAARHLLRASGLVALLVLPALAVVLPAWELPLAGPRSALAAGATATSPAFDPPADLDEPAEPRVAASYRREPVVDEPATAAVSTAGVAAPREVAPRSKPAPLAWVPWLWGVGAAFVLLRLGVGWFRVNRIAIEATPLVHGPARQALERCARQVGLARPPRVLTTDALRLPVLWGFVDPTLLLPRTACDWDRGRLDAVLLHELAHRRRADGLWLLLGRLSVALWWFHPLAWWVERAARADCERAADDVVLACGERPSRYAGQLLAIAGQLPARAPASTLGIAERNQLAARVRSILSADARRGLRRRGAWVLSSLSVVAVVSIASAQWAERAEASTPERIASPSAATQAVRIDDDDRGAIMLAHDRPGDGERRFREALALHRQERWDEAAAGFIAAADEGYREAVSLYNAACGYARLGQAERAVELIERAVDAGFDDPELIASDRDLDPIRREATFRRMIDELPGAHRASGGRYEGAVDRYDDLVAQDSTDGRAWYDVGSALLGMRESDRAIDALDRAARMLDGNANALYNLACAYSLAGDERQALDHLERAVAAGFDSEERFRNDSDLDGIRETARFAEIERLHDRLSLARFRSWWNWGSDYSARRWAPAVEDYTELVGEQPGLGRAWSNLGWGLHHSRRFGEAREAFLEQYELGYQRRLAAYNVGCTYAMEERPDEALDWLGKALDAGSISVGQLLGDDDLRGLHDDPRFDALLERAADDEDDAEDRREYRRILDDRRRRSHDGARLY
ncbi:MAG TPA: M56 family metallopeptidase [Candidatus Polarisedimenticolaceae bacterium]|nr:M56 family metallopeptidase [Candidatus Polarisedimenticolaceae bacterium]